MVRPAWLPGVTTGRALLPWHPAAVRVEGSRLGVPSARPSSVELALPAEDGRLWPGGKRAGWNREHDLATGAPLNRPGRDAEIRRRLAAGESVRSVARALCAAAWLPCSGRWRREQCGERPGRCRMPARNPGPARRCDCCRGR